MRQQVQLPTNAVKEVLRAIKEVADEAAAVLKQEWARGRYTMDSKGEAKLVLGPFDREFKARTQEETKGIFRETPLAPSHGKKRTLFAMNAPQNKQWEEASEALERILARRRPRTVADRILETAARQQQQQQQQQHEIARARRERHRQRVRRDEEFLQRAIQEQQRRQQ